MLQTVPSNPELGEMNFDSSTPSPEEMNQVRSDLKRKLEQFRLEMEQTTRQMEERYVEICIWFGGLIKDARQYGQGMDKDYSPLVETFSEHFLKELESQTQHLNRMFLDLQQKVRGGESITLEITDRLTELNRICNGPMDNASALHTCALGLEIESSLSEKCKQALVGFPEQVNILANRITDGFNQITQSAHQADEAVGEARHFYHSVTQGIEKIPHSEIEKRQQLSSQIISMIESVVKLIRAGDLAGRKIRKLASAGKYYLQYGDIVRQKGEHVLAGLDKILELLDNPDQEKNTDLKSVLEVLSIQCDQIECLGGECLEANSQMELIILELVKVMDETCDFDLKEINASFDEITAEMEQMNHRMVSAVDAVLRIDGVVDHTAQLVRGISVHRKEISRINERLKILAINSRLKTKILKREAEVINTISNEICIFQKSTCHSIHELDRNIREIEQKRSELTCQVGAESVRSENDSSVLPDWILKMQTIQSDLSNPTSDYKLLARQLKDQIIERDKHYGSLCQVEKAFRGHYEGLVSILSGLKKLPSEYFSNGASDDQFVDMSEQYTMQSEREVLDKWFSRERTPSNSSQAGRGAHFKDMNTDGQNSSEIEWFEEEEKEQSEFGDNVEFLV